MSKKIILILIITFAYFVNLKNLYAYDNFVDDFWIKDSTKWNYNENEGNVYLENGVLRLTSYNTTFPIITRYFDGGVFSDNQDSTFEFRFKNGKIGPSGNGLGIGFTGLNGRPFYEFQIWADTFNKVVYFATNDYFTPTYGNCTSFNTQDYYSKTKVVNLVSDYNWHTLRIEKHGTKWIDERYFVYLDKDTNQTPIFVSDLYQCSPNYVWIGNPLTGVSDWSEFSFDYVASFEGLGNVVLPPPPIINKKSKIIIIPGLGASWNTDAMVYGKSVADDSWKMTPFVKNYDNLIKGLKSNGLVEGVDYYVWNYDWRKPISQIVEKLNSFIDLNINADEKVVLVGHSLGAVTARIWAQDHHGDSRIDKIIGLAGPQMGSIEAYDSWNGMKLGEGSDVYDVALSLVSILNNRKSPKEFAPVLKDLIPIFDFIKVDGQIKSCQSMKVKNDYLLSKNTGFNEITSFVGTGEKTKQWIVFKNDRDDNKKYVYANGDGTVLIKSASMGEILYSGSNHGDIVDKNLNEIMNVLGLGTTNSKVVFDNKLDNKMLFFIGSPAKFEVFCNGKSLGTNDEQGFLITEVRNSRKCRVVVTGTANGIYHLVTARIGDKDSWHYYENKIKLGQVKTIQFDGQNGHEDREHECGDRKF